MTLKDLQEQMDNLYEEWQAECERNGSSSEEACTVRKDYLRTQAQYREIVKGEE